MAGSLAKRTEHEADYGVIELAVMETERGRWFLAEYARRNRYADTQVLLSAMSRIEKSIAIQREPGEMDKFRLDILEMSRAIAKTRSEIAAIKPTDNSSGRILEASGELDSIVGATEKATSDILAAAEQVQELAWTMREAGGDAGLCDALDLRATEIYTACSFQDLTAQRIRKVIEALGFLEQRVNAMVEIWNFDDQPADESRINPNDGLARDPYMSQADVDFVLVEEPFDQMMANEEGDRASDNEIEMDGVASPFDLRDSHVDLGDVMTIEEGSGSARDAELMPLSAEGADMDVTFDVETALEADIAAFSGEDEAPPADAGATEDETSSALPEGAPFSRDHLQLVHSAAKVDAAVSKVREGKELSPDEAAQALDALQRMSLEERTRLFS